MAMECVLPYFGCALEETGSGMLTGAEELSASTGVWARLLLPSDAAARQALAWKRPRMLELRDPC